MNIEKQIHDFLVYKCGTAKEVKGISAVQLGNLKRGKSGISTKKLKEVLELNNIVGSIKLETNGNVLIINL